MLHSFLITRRYNLKQIKKMLKNSRKHFVFITAHPDDECMFFTPSIIDLVGICSDSDKGDVSIICLSNGIEGEIRENELFESASKLGLQKRNVTISTLHKDAENWQASTVSEEIERIIESKFGRNNKDVILITFDKKGVSGHKNHISCYLGVSELISKRKGAIKGFALESVNIFRKFSSTLDIFPSLAMSNSKVTLLGFSKFSWKAMLKHKSQLKWYRFFYLALSRYTLINQLVEIPLKTLKID